MCDCTRQPATSDNTLEIHDDVHLACARAMTDDDLRVRIGRVRDRARQMARDLPPPAHDFRKVQKAATIHPKSAFIRRIPAINSWAGLKLARW